MSKKFTPRAILTQIQTDSNTGGQLNRHRNSSCQPLSETQNRKSYENKTLDEDGSQGKLILDGSRPVESNNSVCEVCVEPHSRCKSDWHVGAKTHHKRGEGGNSGGSGNKITADDAETEIVINII